MPSHNSPVSGLQPDPYILASWLNHSPLVSKHRTRASGRDVSTLCYDAALSMPLESKSELKVEGACKSNHNTMTPTAYAIKAKFHEELCSPSHVNAKIEEVYHEENGSIQSETATKILAPCPGETFDLPPASVFGIEGCACSPLMLAFNGLCEHRTQSVHFLDYDYEDDGENDNRDGNEYNSGKDVSEGNIELSDSCSEDESNYIVEQTPSVEVPTSSLYSDPREVTPLNIVANHQNRPLHNLSPTELPEPKDVTNDAVARPYEVPDPTVELASRLLFPISDRTNMPVLDPNGQLRAELHQHPQIFDSEGGDLRGENHGGLMGAGCQRLDTHPKPCHIRRKSFFDSVRLNLSAHTLCYLALNKPSSCRLVFSTILKFVRDDCSPSVSASRRGFYILQRLFVVRLFGTLSRRSVHLRLTGNYRYRTNASGAGGSGSSSGQGDFNFSFSGQYGGESPFGGYGAAGFLYGSQNYSTPDGEVLSRNHNQQLFAGPNATGHHQVLNSSQFVNPRALLIHQPTSDPSQAPVQPYPLYHSDPLAHSGGYEGALRSAGSISHTPFPSVDSGHSNVSPSVLPHAPHLENTLNYGMIPLGYFPSPAHVSQPPPTFAGPSSQQYRFTPGGSTSETILTQSRGEAITVNTPGGYSSSDSAKRSEAQPRKKSGPKPSNKTCLECGQKFDRPRLLKDHMHVHTGVKEHICQGCGGSFAYKTNLQRHHRENKCKGHGTGVRS